MKYITLVLLLSSATLAEANDTFLQEVADSNIELNDTYNGAEK